MKKDGTFKIVAMIEPVLYISYIAHEKMEYIIDKMGSKEIGWLGIVSKHSDEAYLLEDIIIPKQEVTGATTEIREQFLGELMFAMIAREGGEEVYNKIRLWGHSHHSMGVGPSGQDDKQFADFIAQFDGETTNTYFIRLIANNKGLARVDLYDKEKNLKFESIEVKMPRMFGEEFYTELDDIIKANVAEKVFVTPSKTPVVITSYSGSKYGDDEWADWRAKMSEIMAEEEESALPKRKDKGTILTRPEIEDMLRVLVGGDETKDATIKAWFDIKPYYKTSVFSPFVGGYKKRISEIVADNRTSGLEAESVYAKVVQELMTVAEEAWRVDFGDAVLLFTEEVKKVDSAFDLVSQLYSIIHNDLNRWLVSMDKKDGPKRVDTALFDTLAAIITVNIIKLDADTLVRKYMNVNKYKLSEALEELAEKVNVTISYQAFDKFVQIDKRRKYNPDKEVS